MPEKIDCSDATAHAQCCHCTRFSKFQLLLIAKAFQSVWDQWSRPSLSLAECVFVFTSQKTSLAGQDWLAWRGPEITYLFCPIYQGKAVDRDLSTTTVKRLVKSAAKAAGLDQEDIDAFSGHSLRVGAAQDLLGAGYDAAAIMRAGGWKSVNILGRYLEMAEHNVWE